MVTDVTPGIISDFVVGVFHHNAQLRAVVVRFNNTDIEKVRSGLELYVPKRKGDISHNSCYIGEGDEGSLLSANRKPSLSEIQQGVYCKTPLLYEERALSSTQSKLYPVKLAEDAGVPVVPPAWHCIPIILCVDACLLWRTSATRADVYVVVWPSGRAAAGDPKKWATWWVMTGANHCAWLIRLSTSMAKSNTRIKLQCGIDWRANNGF